jgi:glycosyltransferase involved in cell wall biosynthesis
LLGLVWDRLIEKTVRFVGQVTERRIIYILEPFSFPFGGAATIYRHVEVLNENGIASFVAISEKPKIDFYQTTAPLLIHGGRLQPRTGDIFVIPEGFPKYVEALISAPVKRLMFCQNQYYLPFTTNSRAGIAEFGVHGIIASSIAVQNFFRDVYGVADLPILPYAIDTKRFVPAEAKRRQIAFMPRKLPEDARFIAATFKRRYPHYADIPWVPIDGAVQANAARMMGLSAVFLSLSHKESFGLPPLEAMACGCLVVGYYGDGGREYVTPQNGCWAESGDWKACVDGIAAAIELFDRGGAELDTRRQAALLTVERYSPGQLEYALTSFWRRELSTPFP